MALSLGCGQANRRIPDWYPYPRIKPENELTLGYNHKIINTDTVVKYGKYHTIKKVLVSGIGNGDKLQVNAMFLDSLFKMPAIQKNLIQLSLYEICDTIPSSIRLLKNLRRLEIGNCKLGYFPKGVLELHQLKVLVITVSEPCLESCGPICRQALRGIDSLPKSLYFLYYGLRPIRLLYKHRDRLRLNF